MIFDYFKRLKKFILGKKFKKKKKYVPTINEENLLIKIPEILPDL